MTQSKLTKTLPSAHSATVARNRTIQRRLAFVFFTLISAVPAAGGAQSASALFDKMSDADAKRSKGVSDYAMDITMVGHDSTLYYERVSIPRANARPIETFRLVTFNEMQSRQQAGQGMPPDAWQAYSDGLRQSGSAMDSEMDRERKEAGFPPGLLDGMGAGASEEPWASPNPGTMMNSMADFASAAGGASAKGKVEADADKAAMAQSMSLFRKRAKIVGKETIGKTRAIHARAEDLNLVDEVDGEEITIHTMNLWIDAVKYVPVKLRIDGTVTQKRKSREFFIERLDLDSKTPQQLGLGDLQIVLVLLVSHRRQYSVSAQPTSRIVGTAGQCEATSEGSVSGGGSSGRPRA